MDLDTKTLISEFCSDPPVVITPLEKTFSGEIQTIGEDSFWVVELNHNCRKIGFFKGVYHRSTNVYWSDNDNDYIGFRINGAYDPLIKTFEEYACHVIENITRRRRAQLNDQ